jgi:hypothetical protein
MMPESMNVGVGVVVGVAVGVTVGTGVLVAVTVTVGNGVTVAVGAGNGVAVGADVQAESNEHRTKVARMMFLIFFFSTRACFISNHAR